MFNSITNVSSFPFSLTSMLSITTFSQLFSALSSNFNFSFSSLTSYVYTTNQEIAANKINFESNDISTNQENIYTQLDSSSNFRNNLFTNPIISYDYKCGHYLGI
jgi:hypothetical protein